VLCDEEHEHDLKNGTPDAEAKKPAPLSVCEQVEAGVCRYIPNGISASSQARALSIILSHSLNLSPLARFKP
jgi:hypothetical protein